MKQLPLLLFLVGLMFTACDSESKQAQEKVIPPWEAPKSAARAAKEKVEAGSQEVNRQLEAMTDNASDIEEDEE